MYGATSFVGVVHVLHYPAGEAADTADLALGNYDSARGSAAFALPRWGNYRQSFAASGESHGFADKREKVSDGRLLYRGALDVGEGKFRWMLGQGLVGTCHFTRVFERIRRAVSGRRVSQIPIR